jgi:hypothetical protein
MKLSEKGFERRSECGFGRYIGAKTGPIVPLRCPGRPRLTHLRDFSDSFMAKFAFWRFSEVRIAPVQPLSASPAEIGTRRVLS